MFCDKCGSEVPDNANFCDACGTTLTSAPIGAPVVRASAAPTEPTVVVAEKPASTATRPSATYKRTTGNVILSICIVAFGVLVAMIGFAGKVEPVIVGSLLALGGFSLLFWNNIRIELSGEHLRFYRAGKIKQDLVLTDYENIRYSTRTHNGATSVALTFYPKDGGKKVNLDCTGIGKKQADQLWAIIRKLTATV